MADLVQVEDEEPPDLSSGLGDEEVEARRLKWGLNALEGNSTHPIIKFLFYFWNPLSWVMEFCAGVSLLLGDYVDALLIFALLIINAVIGFWEEHNSGKAVDALKGQLQPNSRVKRNSKWVTVPSKDLVPDDLILLKLGDVVPADCKLLRGEPIQLDQSSLTGESLPVTKYSGDECLSGAIVKTGEIEAVVTATGVHSFFGRSAMLVQKTESSGHFQEVLQNISKFCILYVSVWVIIEMILMFALHRNPCTGLGWPNTGECASLNNALVIIVGGIPIAMPTVLSVTMAIGAAQLAKKHAIVTRLSAVEELAGMDILCSDKTGTLTLNELIVQQPIVISDIEVNEKLIMLHAAKCSNDLGSDAIDQAILDKCDEKDKLQEWERILYIPFNPTDKRVLVCLREKRSGQCISICKGAPQIVVQMCSSGPQVTEEATSAIDRLAKSGYRTIGVATATGELVSAEHVDELEWHLEGFIPLFDPPRSDTADTVKEAKNLSVSVKMITGDQMAIAKETCRQLEISDDIYRPADLEDYEQDKARITKFVEEAGGFSGVYPEHKYKVVDILQEAGHVVGMTGDGVNDAPALKKADIGIAVAGATDAARAAADIVLLDPGLSVIIDAIIGSRKIFQRMLNYATYAITTTIRIVTTFALLTMIFNWFFSVILIALMAILNDGTILTISTDLVKPTSEPNEWRLPRIIFRATVYGLYLSFWTILLFVLARETTTFRYWFGMKQLTDAELRGLIYIQVSVSGQATIFITRSTGWWFRERPSKLLMVAFVFAQVIATVIGIFGFFGYPWDGVSDFEGCGWAYALVAWFFAFSSFFLMDFVKFFVDLCIYLYPSGRRGRFRSRVRHFFRHPVYDGVGNRMYSFRHPFSFGTRQVHAPPPPPPETQDMALGEEMV